MAANDIGFVADDVGFQADVGFVPDEQFARTISANNAPVVPKKRGFVDWITDPMEGLSDNSGQGPELAQALQQTGMSISPQIPRVEAGSNRFLPSAGAAAVNTLSGLANFAMSPVGPPTLVAGMVPGAQLPLAALFSGLMAKDAGSQLGEASVTGNMQQGLEGGLALGLAALPAAHVGTGVMNKVVPARRLATALNEAPLQPMTDVGFRPVVQPAGIAPELNPNVAGSPELRQLVDAAINERLSGLVMPRGVSAMDTLSAMNKPDQLIGERANVGPHVEDRPNGIQGGQISFAREAEARGIPDARQVNVQQLQNPVLPEDLTIPFRGSMEGVSYRQPKPAPSVEEVTRREQRANVERGLTMPEVPMEPLPAEAAQYPQGAEPTGVMSQLQRERAANLLEKSSPSEDVRNAVRLPQQPNPQRRGIAQVDLSKRGESGAFNADIVKDIASTIYGGARDFGKGIKLYSEPMIERFGKLGGAATRAFANTANEISSRAKGYYGSVTPLLDDAKKAVSTPLPANSWLRKLHPYNESAAVNNLYGQNEGTVPTVPKNVQPILDRFNKGNTAIGGLASVADPGFVPTGKLQRNRNGYGMTVIKRGPNDPAWQALVKGTADANGQPVAKAAKIFTDLKEALDAPGVNSPQVNAINQDFERFFPKTVTHIKVDGRWHEVLHADAFNYLEVSAQKTAHAAAFRQFFKPGSGDLTTARQQVQAELKTDKGGAEFDNIVKALQGDPIENFDPAWSAPDTTIGKGLRVARDLVAGPTKALTLSNNFINNLSESVVGGPAIFLGYGNALRGMADVGTRYRQMERLGSVNKAMQNWAFDPNQPVRSASRIASNTIRSATAQQVLNEFQEAHAAASAHTVRTDIDAGKLTPYEQGRMSAVFRSMGFSRLQAGRMLGGDSDLLNQFERKAASWLTSGNQAMTDKSKLGANRVFNELFWFHSYPQMTLNQIRAVGSNLFSDVKIGNRNQAWHNSVLMGRLLAGRAAQGALAIGLVALANEGVQGVMERKNELADEKAKFMKDAFLAAVGGPLAIANRAIGTGGSLKREALFAAAPVSLGSELLDMANGVDNYSGKTLPVRIGQFIESKASGYRAVKNGLALFGLVHQDNELDTATRAFYRWRRGTLGASAGSGGGSEDTAAFRETVKKATDALKRGEDWRSVLAGQDAKEVSKSLYGRTLLKGPDGKPLTDEQLGKLEAHIGKPLVERLQANDAMIRQLARELGEQKADVAKVTQPTGAFAIDADTQTKRQQRSVRALRPEVQDWLKTNKFEVGTYTPSVSYGRKEVLLRKEDTEAYEKILSERYNALLTPLLNNTRPTQKLVSERLEQARKQAEARWRSGHPSSNQDNKP